VLLALGLALVAGHGVALRALAARVALPGAALAGAVVLVLALKHLALAGAFRTLAGALRRRARR
jgi:hypothetical protein